MLPRRALAALLIAVVATTLPACSSDAPTDDASVTAPITLPAELRPPPSSTASLAPAPTSTSVPGTDAPGVTVTSFVVRAPLTCEGADFVARVEWVATGAVGATVIVDGAPVDDLVPLAGPADITLPCDGSARPVLLVLTAADGSSEIRSQAVLASPAG